MKETMPKKSTTPNDLKEVIHAKHVFTQEELLELSRSLGRTCSEISQLESEKSACTKDFGFRIETKEIQRDSLVAKVTSGYEMRPTECIVVLDPPNHRKEYFTQLKDGTRGELVEQRDMSAADYQMALPVPEVEKETP